jgi:Calx-beta domain
MRRIFLAVVLALGLVGQSRVVSTQTPPARTYLLAEGATGSFFDTEILLANPHTTPTPVTLTFLTKDGVTIVRDMTLPATSRTTVRVDDIPGLEATEMSTVVTSTSGAEIVVERTMTWDATGYGAHTEKAAAGAATEWYFAEGSQGTFFTYLLLVNPQTSANVAHVTFLREGAPPVTRDYALAPSSRRTIFAGEEPDLVNTSFGAHVVFDQPGAAERAMYFGLAPLFTGGHESAGVTSLSTDWFLAEGATGTFFTTFILLANPGTQDAIVTITYLPADTAPVINAYTVPAGRRLTLNIAGEHASLASAAVGARIHASEPVIVERAQYWPGPFENWYEAHNSFGLTETGTRWGLAEGRVGGTNHDQTYILLANPGTVPSDVHIQFLRTNGAVVNKDFTVQPTSRLNVAVTGPGSHVPELNNESFGAVIDATEPIAVERSFYRDVGGVTWAAGTNATATRLSPPQPLTVTVAATDADASEVGPNSGTFTFTRTGGNPATSLTAFFTIGGSATNGGDYQVIGGSVFFPANQTSVTVTIAPFQDNNTENAETVSLTLTPNNAYTVGTPNAATVTITDSVATVSIAATDATASESGPDSGTFTLTRTAGGNLGTGLTVFFTIGGSATNGGDYQVIGGSAFIPANQNSVTVAIAPFRDNAIEDTESVSLTINPNNAYVVGASNTASITIADSVTTVNVTATDANASEAGPGTGTFTFTRTTDGNPTVGLTVFHTIGGSATNGGDYQVIGGSIFIPANQTSTTLTITPFADNSIEGAETMSLTLNANNAYHVGAANAAGISIADSVTTVSIDATDDTASETGPDTGTFTFTRSAGGNQATALTVFYTISGTATNGADYQVIGGSISIPANQSSVTLTITPIVDAVTEGAETVTLTINANNAYNVGVANAATITIN